MMPTRKDFVPCGCWMSWPIAHEEFAWPVPFVLETQACGFINAEWVSPTHKLTVCYELAEDFADLYRYNDELTPTKKKRKSK